jgi:broad-specificity NMP kinase
MPNRVILVTGTPCVGKTTASRLLTCKLDALHVNLTDLALRENLVLGKYEKRDSIIVDENRIQQKVREIIRNCSKNNIIVDGHYAACVVPKELATRVFVL